MTAIKPGFVATVPCPVCGTLATLGTPGREPFKKYCCGECQMVAQYVRNLYRWCRKHNKKFTWKMIKQIAIATCSIVDNSGVV